MPAEEIKGVTRDQKKQASLGESEIFGRIINEQLITKIVFNSIHLPLRASKNALGKSPRFIFLFYLYCNLEHFTTMLT